MLSLVAIDDNPGNLELLSSALKQEGLRILTAEDPEQGLELVRRERPQIVLTDLVMPKLNGLEVLERVMEFDASIDVILMTAHYSTESAVEAIRKGATDYLNKPVSIAMLRERIGRLLADARERERAMRSDGEFADGREFQGMIGRSALLWSLCSQIRRFAPHYRSALIAGATGTGKELAARAMHALSPVASGHFVALNCPAVVETLFESELFGHVKGAFTGAHSDKAGLLEYAHNGTLFLDEVGDMPLTTQSKLLRALQTQEVQRVGSLAARQVNVRVIAATNHDLPLLIAEKRFREDLYYRLSMVELSIPSLAERKEDLPLLERHFIAAFSRQFDKNIRGLTRRAEIVLARHSWPGNIRELENVLGRACMMTTAETIEVTDLSDYLRRPDAVSGPEPIAGRDGRSGSGEVSPLDEQERALIAEALGKTGGNQSQAARLLHIGRDALRYKVKKHRL